MRALNRHQRAKARRAAAWEASVARVANNFTVSDAKRLQAAIQGTVVLPTDPTYQDARQGFVPNFQDFPQIVVECAVASDVLQALAFARRHSLWVVCRAGGHSTAGYSVNSGMVLDVAAMNDVHVDVESLRAVVGAGCTFGKLNAAIELYGLHVPGGGCPDVAVAGYALGGGYGVTSLMFGMHSDNLERALVALADGSLVIADDSTNRDLFWALQGGTGNNFGVVLELTYRLRPLGELWAFSIGFDLDHAPAALDVVQRQFTGPQVPDRVGHESFLLYVGADRRYLVRGVYDGTRDAGRDVLEPLLSLPGVSVDIDKVGHYSDLNSELLATLPNVPDVARSISDSRFIERPLTEAEWAGVVDVYLETHEPWKAEPGPAVDAVLGDALEVLRIVALLATPAMPARPPTVWTRIGLPGAPTDHTLPGAGGLGRLPRRPAGRAGGRRCSPGSGTDGSREPARRALVRPPLPPRHRGSRRSRAGRRPRGGRRAAAVRGHRSAHHRRGRGRGRGAPRRLSGRTAGCHPHEARHGWDWVEDGHPPPRGGRGGGVRARLPLRPLAPAGPARRLRRPDRAGQPHATCPSSSTPGRPGRRRWPSSTPAASPAARSSTASPAGVDEADACLGRGAWPQFSGIARSAKADDVRAAAPAARSTGCWSRPTRPTWRPSRTGAGPTGRPGSSTSARAVADAAGRIDVESLAGGHLGRP